jgi:SNF2 family DNA or RNA helicase
LVCAVHILKNGKSIVSESVSSLVHQIRKAHEGSTSLYGCVGLTGTPVQNSLDELFCTVNCVLPGILGSIEMFRAHFVRPIKLTLDSTPLDVELERQRAKQLVSIMQIISLRRTKSLIASQLPNKTDSVVFCQMSEVQLRAYQRLLDSPDFMVLKSMRKQCECQSERGIYQCCHAEEIKTGIIWKHFHPFDRACERCPSCIVLPCLIMLAKLANHIDLLKPSSDCTADNREFATSITRLAFGNELQSQNGPISDQQCSTFSEMLQATTGTGKVVIISMYLTCFSCIYIFVCFLVL